MIAQSFAVCVLIMGSIATAQVLPADAPFAFKSVRIGGGGYVCGLLIDPASPDRFYARVDVAGLFALDRGAEAWTPLSDAIPRERRGDFGTEAVALDPQQPSTIYTLSGLYTADWWRGAGSVLKSTDAGRTWAEPVRLSRADGSVLKVGGNDQMRWLGERIAVDPFDSNRLLVGTRSDGLFRSNDAGRSFQHIEVPNDLAKRHVTSILFDRSTKGRVWSAAWDDGVYVSSNSGQTWTRSEGSPRHVGRMTLSPDGTLWVAGNGSTGGVHVLRNGTWADVTPSKDWPPNYCGVAVDPTDPQHVLAATAETDYLKLFRTRDAGKSWTEIERDIESVIPWWIDFMRRVPWSSDIRFDPKDPKRVYVSDWFGVWTIDDISKPRVTFNNRTSVGFEAIVIFDLVPLPDGTLLTASADLSGLRHEQRKTDDWPSILAHPPEQWWQDTYSIDYCRSQPNRLVRVGAKRDAGTGFWLSVSDDSGKTWSVPAAEGLLKTRHSRVAMNSGDPLNYVIINDNQPANVTFDGGLTFATIDPSSLPFFAADAWYFGEPITADPKQPGRFFVVIPDGRVFVTSDGGRTWLASDGDRGVGASGPNVTDAAYRMRASAVHAGRVYVSNDRSGLFVSDDAGKTFRRIDSVDRGGAIALGPTADPSVEAVYLWGTVAGREGVFRSTDAGQTWTKISAPDNNFATTNIIEADPGVPDRLYIGTGGRGVFVGTGR